MSDDGVEAKVRKVVTCLVDSEEVRTLVTLDNFPKFVKNVCDVCDKFDLEGVKAPKRKVMVVLWNTLHGNLGNKAYVNYLDNLASIFEWPWATERYKAHKAKVTTSYNCTVSPTVQKYVDQLFVDSTIQRMVIQHQYGKLIEHMQFKLSSIDMLGRMKVRVLLWRKLQGADHNIFQEELRILERQRWKMPPLESQPTFTTCNAPPFRIERWHDGSLKAFEVDDNCKLSVTQEATLRSLKKELALQVGCETATGRMTSTMPSFQELQKSSIQHHLNKGETCPKLQVDGSYTTGSNRGKGDWYEYLYGDELQRTEIEESLVQAIWGKAREARKHQGLGMSYGSSSLLGFKAINFDDLETRCIAVAGGADYTYADSTYADRVWGSSYPAMLLGLASLGQSFGSDQANKLSKGNIMSTKAYQSITTNYVYGVDITTMNDQQLIAAIKRAKTEKNTLSDVSESKKVQGMMKDIDDAIVKMTEALDAKS